MFDNLGTIAWGVVIFGVVIVIGSVVLVKMGDAIATCPATWTYSTTTHKCLNSTGENPTDPTNTAWVTSNYATTQLGSTGGGLASYTPLIIVAVIGFLILGLFFNKQSTKA